MVPSDPAVTVGRVERVVAGYGRDRALVAFSGGVDSAVVLAVAARALGTDAVTAVTAVSASYPRGELDAARRVAASLDVPHVTVATGEVEREAYARNDEMRCYHCKVELYATLDRMARMGRRAGTVVLTGANADDRAEFRPGLGAGDRHGVRNPLLEAGVGKRGVRAMAGWLGLSVAEKPALACLSSRVAYGIRITPGLLRRVDAAERAVRALGFDHVRVRHLGPAATIEVPLEDVGRLEGHPALGELTSELARLGWKDVAVDPRGYRSGSLNEALPAP